VFRIDLERCEITSSSGRRLPFEMHPLQREALLSGRDSIDLTLQSDQRIAEFQQRDRELRPWVYALAEDADGA
jgi:3-isopropylmalate dehydratase small subunit